jgi:hypothetical protein
MGWKEKGNRSFLENPLTLASGVTAKWNEVVLGTGLSRQLFFRGEFLSEGIEGGRPK